MQPRRLLAPEQLAARRALPVTARAFRTGAQIHPNRAAYEFYPTPPEATRALLSVETFDGDIWEPACGEGHIAKELMAAGYSVTSTDLVDYAFGEPGRDFLQEQEPLAKHIVTNPPYGRGLADAFTSHALKLTARTGGSVALLMNLAGLCHPMRHDFYVNHPPAVIYALDECTCWPYGDPARASRSIASQRYCWMVWKSGHQGDTRFRWLSTRPFQDCPRQTLGLHSRQPLSLFPRSDVLGASSRRPPRLAGLSLPFRSRGARAALKSAGRCGRRGPARQGMSRR